MDQKMLKDWARARDLRRSRKMTRWYYLVTPPKPVPGDHWWDDHGELWNHHGRPACYTSHPYDLTDSVRLDLLQTAQDHGLTVEIHPPGQSWYSPHAWLVVLWKAGLRDAYSEP